MVKQNKNIQIARSSNMKLALVSKGVTDTYLGGLFKFIVKSLPVGWSFPDKISIRLFSFSMKRKSIIEMIDKTNFIVLTESPLLTNDESSLQRLVSCRGQ